MTSSVVVFSAMTYDREAFRKCDISEDGEVACGIVVSRRECRGDGRLVDGEIVFGAMT